MGASRCPRRVRVRVRGNRTCPQLTRHDSPLHLRFTAFVFTAFSRTHTHTHTISHFFHHDPRALDGYHLNASSRGHEAAVGNDVHELFTEPDHAGRSEWRCTRADRAH